MHKVSRALRQQPRLPVNTVGGADQMKRISCVDCGVVIPKLNGRHRRCPPCGAAHSAARCRSYHAARDRNRVRGTYVCALCGKTFPHNQSRARVPTRCRPCADAERKKPRKAARPCRRCGAAVPARRRSYCSDACSMEANKRRLMGLYRAALDATDVPKAMMWRHRWWPTLRSATVTAAECANGRSPLRWLRARAATTTAQALTM